jgi:ATP phosphoribosyltransferase regulatory subunit
VAQKRWVEDRLEAVFHRWGYHRIITSTVEHMETLMAGGAIEQSTVIELYDGQGQRLGLRPELTASIARAAVTRINEVTYPQRLCYSANVFRRSATGSHGGQQEYFQAGVELLGASGLMADAEVLLLLADCLRELGLTTWQMILGEADLTRSLLMPFPEAIRGQVRVAIATLDRVTLESLPLSPDLRDYGLQIMDLRGDPQTVLKQVSQLPLTDRQCALVDGLTALISLLAGFTNASDPQAPTLVLDLSLIQPFDYYTGIVFEVVGGANCEVLGQGGRYDHLLGMYHPTGKGYPGIGFVLKVETLQQLLLSLAQLPVETPPSEWLVIPTALAAAAAAITYAQTLRQSTPDIRVELNLDLDKDPAALRALAQQRRIQQIAWITENGEARIEPVEGRE